MNKIKKLCKKLQGHYDELGFWGGTKWFLHAIYFRSLMFITRNKSLIKGEGNIKKNSKNPNFVYKKGKRVFIFATVPYYDIGGGQRSAQLAKTFNLLGYEVFYIYGARSSESIIYDMEIPTIRHLFIDEYHRKDFQNQIRKNDIVIVEFPHLKFLPFIELAKQKGLKIVYENIDNWETSLGGGNFDRKNLDQILKSSDLLVGTAKPLVEQLKGYLKELKIKKEVIYAPNAVDDSIFDYKKQYKKPKDFIKGEKTLIYYGSLWGEWFDWDLVFGIAKKYPRYSILLIGESKCVMEKVAKAPKNVHFLGIKKQTDLPAYLYYSDVALVPFKKDKIGEYVSPLKVFEYISMKKTVLSTSLPEVIGYPNVYIGDTTQEWSNYLDKKGTGVSLTDSKFIGSNTWYARCISILNKVDHDMNIERCDKEYFSNISIIVLNYNNKNCIFDCVDSLLNYQRRYNYSIIVVDNGSKDGSYEKLKKDYRGKIKLLKNSKNGCSSGRNLGIRASKTNYIFFLDSDQFVLHEYWLDNFIEYNFKNNTGAIGWSGGWLKASKMRPSSIVDDYPYRYVPANIFARYDLDYLATDGLMVKRELLEKIGGFDELFDPTCFEDTDLAFSIKNAGYRLAYCPYLGIYHLPHQTTKSGSTAHAKILAEHQSKFLKKWKEKNKNLL